MDEMSAEKDVEGDDVELVDDDFEKENGPIDTVSVESVKVVGEERGVYSDLEERGRWYVGGGTGGQEEDLDLERKTKKSRQ